MVAQLLRIAGGDHGAAAGIEKNAVVGDLENTGKFVRHHDNGCTEVVAQFKNQIVEQA